MPQAFDAQNPPFDRLSHDEIERSARARSTSAISARASRSSSTGSASEHLHVVIKGSVEERDGEELEAVLGPKDSFDARALVHGAAGTSFVAAEETLCYLAAQGARARSDRAATPASPRSSISSCRASSRSYARAREDRAASIRSCARACATSRLQPAVFIDGDDHASSEAGSAHARAQHQRAASSATATQSASSPA